MKITCREVIESLIFISHEPLSLDKIKSILSEYTEKQIESAIQELLEIYSTKKKGIQIVCKGGGYLFTTKPECDPWIRRLLKEERKSKLSPAALETLSVVAYHQPMTLAEISDMRGVDASHALKTLLNKRLIKIVGRKKGPGKPLIYRTTNKFLGYFGLNTLKDLPSQDEISKILDENKINVQ